MQEPSITFSFGKNWCDYLQTITEREVASAQHDIETWLGRDSIAGKTVVDVGSGSGVHSLAFHHLGATCVCSFDLDEKSVQATRTVWEKAGSPANWRVMAGSILDDAFVRSLGRFDIVYSWGVLHHTGELWKALEACFGLVKPGGRCWISLYAKGPHYAQHLALKQKFNAASPFGKQWLLYKKIGRIVLDRLRHGRNPFTWNETTARGMTVYHDLVDWLGGLPYEVAHENDVLRTGRNHGLVLEQIAVSGEGGCSVFVFHCPGSTP